MLSCRLFEEEKEVQNSTNKLSLFLNIDNSKSNLCGKKFAYKNTKCTRKFVTRNFREQLKQLIVFVAIYFR